MKFNLTHSQLKSAEKSVYSQGGQDGVLEAIFKQLKIKNGFCIEFGARDGIELSNTCLLRNNGWTGLLMDAEPLSDNVRQEFITKDNINSIFEKHNIPNEVDLLCVDIDGNDAWVLESINIRPKLIVIEFNSKFKNNVSVAIEYNESHTWDGDDYYGASLLALNKIATRKGYTLIYTVAQFDAFFLRNDLLDEKYIQLTLDEIFPEPIIAHEKVSEKKWVEIK